MRLLDALRDLKTENEALKHTESGYRKAHSKKTKRAILRTLESSAKLLMGGNYGVESMRAKFQDLPVKERIKIVEDLWDSIAVDQKSLPLTAEQKAELDRRLDTYEVDKNQGRLAVDAVADIRRKL